MDEIVRLILDSSDQFEEKAISGTLGEKMRSMALDHLNRKLEDSELDDEETLKIIHLKECEENNDLCWMDWDSWNSFSKPFQKAFAEIVNPLFWSGLYFQYSKFMDSRAILFRLIDHAHTIYILKNSESLRLIAIGDKISIYDYLGTQAMNRVSKEFKNNILLTMGITKEGNMVCKEHVKDKDE